MPNKSAKDKQRRLSDNKKLNNAQSDGNRLSAPVNRNLSTRLFGQLWTLKDKTS